MKTRRIYDISMSIREGMVTWPGEEFVKVERIRSMANGDRLNLTRLEMGAHTGTHIDAPFHFVDGGAGVETISPSMLVGPALVIEMREVREIGRDDLEAAGISEGITRVLLKTDNVELIKKEQFDESFSHIKPDGARYLVDRGIKVLGVDYLSVAEYGKGEEVHRTLLTEGTVVIEGLDMRGVPPGIYQMVALPLKISGADGAPARVVLFSL
jgi:arylformamidase